MRGNYELCSFALTLILQLISLDLEQSVGSVWFVRVACFNAIDLQRRNHTFLTDCSKSSEINCTGPVCRSTPLRRCQELAAASGNQDLKSGKAPLGKNSRYMEIVH